MRPEQKPSLRPATVARGHVAPWIASLCTAAAFVVFAGCGGGSGSPSGGGGSGGDGTVWVLQGTFLEALDTATGETSVGAPVLSWPNVPSCGGRVTTMVPSNGKVWLGCNDGNVVVVDRETGEGSLIEIEDSSSSYGVDTIAVSAGFAYIGPSIGPTAGYDLVKIDAATLAVSRKKQIAQVHWGYDGILADSEAVWVITDNDYHLLKIDPGTLEVLNDITLPGVNPYYAGMLQVGNKIWMIDDNNDRYPLWSVDKSGVSLQPTQAAELDDFIEEGDIYANLTTNQEDIFILLCNDDAFNRVLRLDGATGQHTRTYDIGTGDNCGPIAVSSKKMYIQSPTRVLDVLQIDLDSGETTATFSQGNAVKLLAVE